MTKTIETVTDEQLAELEALRQGADYLAYQAFAVMLAPKMAAHLAALKATGKAMADAWDAESDDGCCDGASDLHRLCGGQAVQS